MPCRMKFSFKSVSMTLLSSFSSAQIKYLRHKQCKPELILELLFSDFNAQSIHSLGKKCSDKFSQIHWIKQGRGPTYPRNEFWINSKHYYLVYKCTIYANPTRFHRDGKTSEMTSWICWIERQSQHRKSKESCPDYPRALPFWNNVPVPVLLLTHSHVTQGVRNATE